MVLTKFSAGNYVIRSTLALKREVFRFNPKSGWRRGVNEIVFQESQCFETCPPSIREIESKDS